jgi:hypothetical protein
MKKLLLSSFAVALNVMAYAQLPVSTAPSNKTVVLEEFTGIHCGYCPDGHKIANDIKAANTPGKVIPINIHTGGYATPSGSEPDYRTAEGNAIAAISTMGITGYPTGSMNRHVYTGTAITMSRGVWAQYATQTLAQSSYVNVALQGTLNVTSRLLTVNVEVYYTGASPASTNNLTVMLLENNVVGPQSNYGNYNPTQINADGTYNHQHMLRKVLNTSAMGEVLSTTTSGTLVQKQYTYTIPAQFVNNTPQLGNLELVAFVAESNTEIISGAYGPITLSGFAYSKDAQVQTVTSEATVCAGVLNPKTRIYNNGSSIITSANLTYNVNGGTNSNYTFNGSIPPATSLEITLPTITFTPTTTNTLNVTVGNVNGAADQNAANNTLAKSAILLTTLIDQSSFMTMDFTQDQYGSECTWKLYDEAANTIIAQDGPWTNLSASGILLHSKSFTVSPNKCYRLDVADAYGDGVNAGTGVGGYKLYGQNPPVALITSNGQYGKGESRWFKTASSLSVDKINGLSELTVYPNPAKDMAKLNFSLEKASNLAIAVYDQLGQLVQTVSNSQFNAGLSTVEINTTTLNTGIYSIRIDAENGTLTQRISVIK